jgi:hypothetical protein
MGYSVAVPIRSYDLRDRMVRLLNQEYKTWAELHGGTKDDPAYVSHPAKHDLSYDHLRCKIGMDYNAHGGERHYTFALIRWMALRIGRRTPIAKQPYYIYDGYEALPVQREEVLGSGNPTVDRWGVPIETPNAHKIKGVWETTYELIHIDEEPDALEVIRKEVQRLDDLWHRSLVGMKVRTTPDGPRDFTKEANALRRRGQGRIIGLHDSHGLCFDVEHDDGGPMGCYDPDEIEVL